MGLFLLEGKGFSVWVEAGFLLGWMGGCGLWVKDLGFWVGWVVLGDS